MRTFQGPMKKDKVRTESNSSLMHDPVYLISRHSWLYGSGSCIEYFPPNLKKTRITPKIHKVLHSSITTWRQKYSQLMESENRRASQHQFSTKYTARYEFLIMTTIPCIEILQYHTVINTESITRIINKATRCSSWQKGELLEKVKSE